MVQATCLRVVILQSLQADISLRGLGGYWHAACSANARVGHWAVTCNFIASVHHDHSLLQPVTSIVGAM